jgi:hypothetical protein
LGCAIRAAEPENTPQWPVSVLCRDSQRIIVSGYRNDTGAGEHILYQNTTEDVGDEPWQYVVEHSWTTVEQVVFFFVAPELSYFGTYLFYQYNESTIIRSNTYNFTDEITIPIVSGQYISSLTSGLDGDVLAYVAFNYTTPPSLGPNVVYRTFFDSDTNQFLPATFVNISAAPGWSLDLVRQSVFIWMCETGNGMIIAAPNPTAQPRLALWSCTGIQCALGYVASFNEAFPFSWTGYMPTSKGMLSSDGQAIVVAGMGVPLGLPEGRDYTLRQAGLCTSFTPMAPPPTPVAPSTPIAPPTTPPAAPVAPPVAPVAPVAPTPVAPVAPVAPTPVAPIAPVAPVAPTPVAPSTPPSATPTTPPATPPSSTPSSIDTQEATRQGVLYGLVFGGISTVFVLVISFLFSMTQRQMAQIAMLRSR